jgi:hypothetical protein
MRTAPAAAIVLFTLTACGPGHTHVERSATYNATLDDVYPNIADLRTFYTWSPWSEMDPTAKTDFSDPSTGMNAWYSWDGNDEVGAGKMTVIADEKNKRVMHKLEFFRPWEGVSESGFALEASGDTVKVTWLFDQDNEGFGRVMAGFIDMDGMLGADFEKGLAKLEGVVAASVAARIEREQKEAQEAAAKREAEQAAAAAEDATAGG